MKGVAVDGAKNFRVHFCFFVFFLQSACAISCHVREMNVPVAPDEKSRVSGVKTRSACKI